MVQPIFVRNFSTALKTFGATGPRFTYVAGYETESTPLLLCWPLFDRNHRNSIQTSRGDVLGNKRSRVCIGIGTSRGVPLGLISCQVSSVSLDNEQKESLRT